MVGERVCRLCLCVLGYSLSLRRGAMNDQLLHAPVGVVVEERLVDGEDAPVHADGGALFVTSRVCVCHSWGWGWDGEGRGGVRKHRWRAYGRATNECPSFSRFFTHPPTHLGVEGVVDKGAVDDGELGALVAVEGAAGVVLEGHGVQGQGRVLGHLWRGGRRRKGGLNE